MNKVELSVKNFRAIKEAHIALNGISVVSGINGCGKSTLSKLLYYVFRNVNAYDELILKDTIRNIRPYLNVVEQMQQTLLEENMKIGASFLSHFKIWPPQKIEDWMALGEMAGEVASAYEKIDKNKPNKARIDAILRSTLQSSEGEETGGMIKDLCLRVSHHLDKMDQLGRERPYSLLRNSLASAFEGQIAKELCVKEYEVPFVSEGVTHVPLSHEIAKTAYIDTPMCLGVKSGLNYWEELNALLRQPSKQDYNFSLNQMIKGHIIQGDASFTGDGLFETFTYKREDGEIFDLMDCATGIKSFAILQMLLKNGFLDDKALLVIDEPEAHLHPQWIVEYARLVVLLHKRLGTKFFIASHSTDFVSAVRYISEKEDCLHDVSFYLAEEAEKHQFVFRSLEHDIEPIFKTFNKSFDKLDAYAGKEEE
ncbi:MAG: ATP-binding protein [Tannerella sp.]|jgi:energy-coupling factor transporter ATP-binding protein EcfA2|nr:ATP-binding protein [Tannerella sp.]